MTKLRLTFGCWNYDRTRALMDDTLRPDGIELVSLNMPVEETFFRMLRHREFDVAEMSLSSYTVSLFKDPKPFVAIPVFPSRFFRFNDVQQIHINQLPDGKPFRAHFCVVVDDFPGAFRRLKAAGAIDVEPWGRVRRLPHGAMQMFVRDPAGNLIEIASAPDAPVDESLFADPLVEREPGIYRISAGEG